MRAPAQLPSQKLRCPPAALVLSLLPQAPCPRAASGSVPPDVVVEQDEAVQE